MMDKTILCIILHYGNEDVTWECVASIIDHNLLDILIADNDPKQELTIPQDYIGKVKIFKTGGTAGFAQANNLAVRFARKHSHNSIFLLNNDTIVLDDAIEKLYGLLNEKDVGLAGPCMPYASEPEKIWACGGTIEKIKVKVYGLDAPKEAIPFEADYLPGAAILCKSCVWDLAGGLPETYYLAYEEADFAIQVRKLGYKILVDPNARILHKVGMSSNIQPMYIYNSIRNRLRFGKILWGKHAGFLLATLLSLIGSVNSFQKLSLWYRAISDEIHGVALDRAALQNIRRLYEK